MASIRSSEAKLGSALGGALQLSALLSCPSCLGHDEAQLRVMEATDHLPRRTKLPKDI